MFAGKISNPTAPSGYNLQRGSAGQMKDGQWIPQTGLAQMQTRGGKNIGAAPVSNPGFRAPATQQTAAGSPSNTITQQGLGSYQTGITAGQLPQQSITNALSALRPSSSLTAASPYGTPVSRQAQSELDTMMQDSLRAGTWGQQSDLNRDAAYQQAQMQLAYDRARSDAALGGFGNLYQQEADRVGNNASRQSMILNLIGALTGMSL